MGETTRLPEDKILKDQILLSGQLLEPGIARAPITLIRKLRGEMEFRSPCALHVRNELAPAGEMIGRKWGNFSTIRKYHFGPEDLRWVLEIGEISTRSVRNPADVRIPH